MVVLCGVFMIFVLFFKSGLKNLNIGKYFWLYFVSICYGYFFEGIGFEGRLYEGGIMMEYVFVNFRKFIEYGGFFEIGVFYFGVFLVFYVWGFGNKIFSILG